MYTSNTHKQQTTNNNGIAFENLYVRIQPNQERYLPEADNNNKNNNTKQKKRINITQQNTTEPRAQLNTQHKAQTAMKKPKKEKEEETEEEIIAQPH